MQRAYLFCASNCRADCTGVRVHYLENAIELAEMLVLSMFENGLMFDTEFESSTSEQPCDLVTFQLERTFICDL